MKQRNLNALVCILCMCKGIVKLATKTCNLFCDYAPWRRDISGKSWWGCASRYSKSCPYFRPQKCHSQLPFSDLAQNIIGSLSDLKLSRLEHQHKIHSKFACYLKFSFFLIHLELKQQKRSNSPIVPSKTMIPDSRPTRKRSRRLKTETTQIAPYPLGRHIYTYMAYGSYALLSSSFEWYTVKCLTRVKKSTLSECLGIQHESSKEPGPPFYMVIRATCILGDLGATSLVDKMFVYQ